MPGWVGSESHVFYISKEISRREVEEHRTEIIGITASIPKYEEQGGQMVWCADVRVGVRENQGLIRGVLIAQWAMGVVTDMNVPVICQKSESGQLTIVARAMVKLPDVSLRTYSYNDLGYVFMTNLTEVSDGVWQDGYGYEMDSPEEDTGVSQTWSWVQRVTSLDELGEADALDKVTAQWEMT